MATKNQHFVPRVYIKSWETNVYSIKEPQKSFTGVYYYDKSNIFVGDGRNKGTILAANHTYTIDFDYTFILSRCREIRIEFAEKIKGILSERNVKAYYRGNLLTSRNAISTWLPYLEEWTFYNTDNTLASKKAITNAIKEVRSYCLEDKFSTYVENRWESILRTFLAPFPKVDGRGQIEYTFPVSQSVIDMLDMVALMMCRNPSFDLLGVFSWLKDDVLASVFSQYRDIAEEDIIMRGCWLTEIYKGLYSRNGFVNTFISSAISGLGMMVLRVANEEEGSFITSDNPVVYHKLLVEASNHNGIYFPLTPQFLLFLGKRSEGNINDVIFRTVCNKDIQRINQIILNGAESSIVSKERRMGYII